LAERTAASLLNKKDDPSPSVPKPFLGSISNVKSPSIEGEKDQSCLISDTERYLREYFYSNKVVLRQNRL